MKPIYQSPEYTILAGETPEPGMVELLKSTLWGTNGPLYQHKDTERKMMTIPQPLFFSLQKQGKTIGTCSFYKRTVSVRGRMYQAWYSRYFAISRQSQGKIFGHLMLKNIRSYFEASTQEPSVFFAYVDKENPRSRKLLKFIGFNGLRYFETLVFTRFLPKADARVTRISEEDKPALLALLKDQYKDYALVNFDRVFFQDNYFVLKINGEIVAGLQATITHWVVEHLPGLSGKIILNVVPHLPLLSRLFNPRQFNFAAFEAIYCKAGFEKELFVLMESVCASLKLYTGMTWLDSESELHLRLKDGPWGIMNRMKDDMPGQVVAAFKDISEEEQKAFFSSPVYISSFDLC